jgi:hypothetical protein
VHLENLCEQPVPVAIDRLRAIADANDGTTRTPVFFDPRGEIVQLHIEPKKAAVERFRLDGAGDPGTLARVCFDVRDVSPSDEPAPELICYDLSSEPTEAALSRSGAGEVAP